MTEAVDTQTFSRLLTEHQSRLYAFVFAQIVEPHLAHDVFQETNRVLWQEASTYDAARPFLPWAFAIARNQVRAARQKRRRDQLTFDDDLVTGIADRMTRREHHDERQIALATCLQRLSAKDRELVEQRYYAGRTVQELAAALRRSRNAIGVSLFRLRTALARCIRSVLEPDQGASA